MLKQLLTMLIVAGAICLAPGFSDSGTLHAGHHHHWRGHRSYYGGPYVGGIGYYRGYRNYGPSISIGIGSYPSYYRYGGLSSYPYYTGYSPGVYYRSPVIYQSPVIIQGYGGYCR